MIPSPGRKPLSELTEEELRGMAKSLNKKVSFSSKDVDEELRYREQRSIADSMRKIVTIQAAIAGVAVVVAVLVAATSLVELVTK